jgi:hypothetical protein
LVVARVANPALTSCAQSPLCYDPSNVVRGTAVEGLGLLAWREPSLRPQIQPLIEEALVSGTIAMQCRARDAMERNSLSSPALGDQR